MVLLDVGGCPHGELSDDEHRFFVERRRRGAAPSMNEGPTWSAAMLVIAHASGDEERIGPCLARFGEVERVTSELALLRLHDGKKGVRAVWALVLARCPEITWAAPLLQDSDGNASFPTGQVTVRFRTAPNERTLRAFAKEQRLVVSG